MIRLIAADMDGTLLDSAGRLFPEFFRVVRLLAEHDVHFIIASGRRYENLRGQFPGLEDTLGFISDNGSQGFYRGECIFRRPIRRERVLPLLAELPPASGVSVLLAGVRNIFLRAASPEGERETRRYFPDVACVPDPLAALGDELLLKMALYDHRGIERSCGALRARYGDEFHIASGAADWYDVMPQEVNKGTALEVFQRFFQVPPSECMAFGDYMNDLEMLLRCGFGYAMANGSPELRKRIVRQAPSNDDNGVLRVIAEHFGFSGFFR